jgi:ATP-binding cassette subfamily B protein
MRIGEKPKDFKKSMSRLVKYSRKYWTPMIISFVCAIIGTVTTLLGPDYIRDLTNIIMKNVEGAAATLFGGTAARWTLTGS